MKNLHIFFTLIFFWSFLNSTDAQLEDIELTEIYISIRAIDGGYIIPNSRSPIPSTIYTGDFVEDDCYLSANGDLSKRSIFSIRSLGSNSLFSGISGTPRICISDGCYYNMVHKFYGFPIGLKNNFPFIPDQIVSYDVLPEAIQISDGKLYLSITGGGTVFQFEKSILDGKQVYKIKVRTPEIVEERKYLAVSPEGDLYVQCTVPNESNNCNGSFFIIEEFSRESVLSLPDE